MKLLIATWALCLVTSSVVGFFLDDANAALLGAQGQRARVKPSSPIKGNNIQSDAAVGTGFIGEIETSLEQAAGALDSLWLRFKRGVLRLLPGFDADNGRPAANGTSPGNLPPQPRPISTELFTTTTARIITATTTASATITTTTLAGATTTTNAVETTTEVTTEIPQSTPIII